MRLSGFALSILVLFASCQSNEVPASKETVKDTMPFVSPPTKQVQDTVTEKATTGGKQKIALNSNSLQLVNAVTGSTKEIAFGMPFEQLITLVSRVLETEPTSIGVNSECGAGPLNMATWSNGLTLVFKETQRDKGNWVFAGWFAGKPNNKKGELVTMAGIGVGSKLEELESAYVTTVTKTTLGYEFAVKSGFYGLLSGKGKQATIDAMWSGTSCNFR